MYLRNKGWDYVKERQDTTKKVPNDHSWTHLNNKINNTILDYTPKYKINDVNKLRDKSSLWKNSKASTGGSLL
jgi:hypothetical protein